LCLLIKSKNPKASSVKYIPHKKEEACVFAFRQIKVELRVPKNKRLKAIQGLFKGKFGEKSPSVCVCVSCVRKINSAFGGKLKERRGVE